MSQWELLARRWEDAFGISRRWSRENGFKKCIWQGLEGGVCCSRS